MHEGNVRLANGRFAKSRFVCWSPERWDDGVIDRRGYFRVYHPAHPSATLSGWVRRFHVVWWLATGEVIKHPNLLHHLRLSNLEKQLHDEHTRHHCSKPPVRCTCRSCGASFLLPQWRLNQGRGRYCSAVCYHSVPKSADTRLRHAAALRVAYAEGRR